MSRTDVMGLGPFQKELEQKLGKLSKDEIFRILVTHGKTVASSERRSFLALFDAAPPVESRKGDPEDDKTLLGDIRAFIADLEQGKYYEGTDFDQETHDYRSYGDESWVYDMDDLFNGAEGAFLGGKRKLAADAYGLLLHGFHLGEEDGHFCGAVSPEEMVATDITEAKARYLRALFETTPAGRRPDTIMKEMHALRHCGLWEMGIKAIVEADTDVPPQWDDFLKAWIELLQTGESDEEIGVLELGMSRRLLREAVQMKDGVNGLARLAGEQGARHPEIFSEWLDALLSSGRRDEALAVVRQAVNTVEDPAAKAVFAEKWVALTDNAADRLEAARLAWRAEPSASRLLILRSVNNPSAEDSNRRMIAEVRHRDTGEMKLNNRTASILLVLAGQYDEAVSIMMKAKPLGWSDWEHPGPVTYPFVLLAVVGDCEMRKGSVLSLWRHELNAADSLGDPFHETAMTGSGKNSGAGLWAAMQSVLEFKPLTGAQRRSFLDAAKEVMLARINGIAESRHRGAYDRAARMLVGWIEAAGLTGHADEAQRILAKVMKDYSRLSSLKREINALIGPSEENKHAHPR